MSIKSARGVSLIESVVTLGVVMLLITGLVVGMTSSLRNAQGSKARTQAVQYAQEALEIARQERDNNWATFADRATQINYCLGSAGQWSAPIDGTCTPFLGTYSRLMTFTLVDPKQVNITVTVSWTEGGSTKNVSLQTILTKWK
jgi:type II secretory pathway pseudopilin PulG